MEIKAKLNYYIFLFHKTIFNIYIGDSPDFLFYHCFTWTHKNIRLAAG